MSNPGGDLSALIDSLPVAVVGVTRHGTIRSWNRGAEALYGYTADEAIGRSRVMLATGQRPDEVADALRRITRGEGAEPLETVLLTKQGQTRDVSLAVSAIHQAGGRLTGFSVVARDISHQRRIEAELGRSSRYFELSRDMVCTAGVDGYFKELNGTWVETLGWTDVELRARPFVDFVHPKDRQATLDETAKLFNGATTVDFVNRYLTRGGEWRWIEWNAKVAAGDQLIYATARDVTERMRAELRVRFQAGLLDAVGQAIVATDLTGAITYWGPGAEAIYGWTEQEVLRRNIADVLPPMSPDGPAEMTDAPARGQSRTHVRELARRDGSTFLAEITDTPVLDDDGRMVAGIGISTDVTAREEANAELAQARDQALQASVVKSNFLANMSHEIRTPMNGVLGMTELLLDTALDPRQREYAETVRTSGDALLTIINDILDLSKIEAGGLELESIDFDLTGVIDDIAELLAGPAQAKGLELVVDVPDDVPALRGDPGRLRQVLTNLVGNAIKFTSVGHVKVSARVVEAAEDRTAVRLQVDDTGIGIDADQAGRVFEPFAQADSSTTRQYGGTGLGLAITRQMVEMMGGHLALESQVGAGSSFGFVLSLPRALADVVSPAPADVDGLRGARVLMVDDNATNRIVLNEYLTGYGMTVEEADFGFTALDAARRAVAAGRPFALVVSDMHMPGMTGVELATALAADPKIAGVPMVLLTSSGDDREMGPARLAGISDRLTKPVRRDRLRASLALVLGGAGLATAAAAAGSPSTGDGGHAPSRGRVLLVEDNLVNQKVAAAMLGGGGYLVDLAVDGEEALRAVQARDYDVVLMDCQMPRMDGYQAAAAIRTWEGEGRHVPIVALTAGAMEEDRVRALAAGMDDYLAKPVKKADVLAAVGRWQAGG
jgi:PAS domain S-box-containing protein